MKKALQLLVQRFEISADKTHVSYLTFARRNKLHNTFNDGAYHSQAAILALISGSIKNLGRQTRLDRAMKTANEKMFILKNGLRPGVGKALVLYTDGKTHPTSKDMSGHVAALKGKGVRIVVVGMGPLSRKPEYRKVLKEIGGENLLFAYGYSSLDDHVNDIMNLVCPSAGNQTGNETSPAGGLKKNRNAVVCTHFRATKKLTCKKGDTQVTCPTEPPMQPRDDKQGGPTPFGEYLIGKRRKHPRHKIDWYNLYPLKEDNSGYYGYTQPTKTGRFAMGLHPGKVSLGCVTVKAPTYDKDPCWQRIRKVIDASNMNYRGSAYSGFLYVVK